MKNLVGDFIFFTKAEVIFSVDNFFRVARKNKVAKWLIVKVRQLATLFLGYKCLPEYIVTHAQ